MIYTKHSVTDCYSCGAAVSVSHDEVGEVLFLDLDTGMLHTCAEETVPVGTVPAATLGPVDPKPTSSFVNLVSFVDEYRNEWPTLAPAAFDGLAGDLVRVMEPHTEADPAALLVQTLIAYGSVIGRAAHFRAEGDRHFTNEYAVIAGESAKGRKGTSWGRVRQPFAQLFPRWAQERVTDGLSSGEGLIWSVRDPITKSEPVKEKGRVVGYQEVEIDPGVDDKRILVVQGEYASTLRVMQRDGNTLSAVLRNAWDSGNLATLTKTSPARATDAHVSLIAHITIDELLRYLSVTESGNGFGNRHLWVLARRSKALPEGGDQDVFNRELEPLLPRLQRAVIFGSVERELRRDDDARKDWAARYEALSAGKPGLLGAMIARAEAHTMRLATIYALMDQSAVITRKHLQSALAVWDYAEASARYIFGDKLGDPVADDLLSALRRNPDGLTRTAISDLFGRNRRSAEIARALETLAKSGLAHCVHVAREVGRSAETWYASTKQTNVTK